MKVADLIPGDVIRPDSPFGPESATFVAQTDHPLYPGLRLVLWRRSDGHWSPDALDPRQDVGTVDESGPEDRRMRLREALHGTP